MLIIRFNHISVRYVSCLTLVNLKNLLLKLMNLTRQDIDSMIRNFRERPSADDYHMINNWYNNSVNNNPDREYMICLYLFLQGANLNHRYHPITIETHRELVKQIRDYVENADPLIRPQRKAYLDFGTKSGYYK